MMQANDPKVQIRAMAIQDMMDKVRMSTNNTPKVAMHTPKTEDATQKAATKAFFRAKKQAEEQARKAKLNAATKRQADLQWPTLEGTEKQVEWATTIRNRLLDPSTNDVKELLKEYSVQKLSMLIHLLAHRTTRAGWWIDNRSHRTLRTLVASVLILEPRFVFEILFDEMK